MTLGRATELSDMCRRDTQYAGGSPAVILSQTSPTNLSQMRGYAHVRQRRQIEYTHVEPLWRAAKTSARHRHERTIRDSSVHTLTDSCMVVITS